MRPFFHMIAEFIRSTPDFYTNNFDKSDIRKELLRTAKNHNSYELLPDEFTERRLNETKAYSEHAQKNYRRLTHELPELVLTKSGKIFNHQGFKLTNSSQLLDDRLADNDIFKSDSGYTDWRTYIIKFLFPASLINPNQLFLYFPYNEDDATANPNDTIDQFKKTGLYPLTVSFESIIKADEQAIIFKGEEVQVENVKANILWAIDKEWWYKLIPFVSDNKIRYREEAWYNHDFRSVPLHWLPGRVQVEENGQYFRKPHIHTSYERLNEFIGIHKDTQTNTQIHAYPHLVMDELDCTSCQGTKRELKGGGPCKKCKGSGKMSKPEPSEAYIRPKDGMNMNKTGGSSRPSMEWYTPPIDALKYLDEKARSIFIDAFKVIGMRPLIEQAESGEAMTKRLQDAADFTSDLAGDWSTFATYAIMHQLELYLKRGAQDTEIVAPKVSKPKSFATMSLSELNTLIQGSEGFIKEDYAKSAYIQKMGENSLSEIIADFAYCYAPLINSSTTEIKDLILISAFDRTDVIRSRYAFKAFEHLSKENKDFALWDFVKAKTEADILLTEWGVLTLSVTDSIGEV